MQPSKSSLTLVIQPPIKNISFVNLLRPQRVIVHSLQLGSFYFKKKEYTLVPADFNGALNDKVLETRVFYINETLYKLSKLKPSKDLNFTDDG